MGKLGFGVSTKTPFTKPSGLFVGFRDVNAPTSGAAYNSTDAITWSSSPMQVGGMYKMAAYADNMFVAVTSNTDVNYGNTSNFSFSSTGTSWTRGYLSQTTSWSSVVAGNNRFLVRWSNGNYIESSNGNGVWPFTRDGSSGWSFSALPTNHTNVKFAGNLFFASTSTTSTYSTSADGVTWTLRTLPLVGTINVAYEQGKYLAVQNSTSNNTAAISTDLVTWNTYTISRSAFWAHAAASKNEFVIGGNNGNGGARSTDGITWTNITFVSTQGPRTLIYNGNIFVASTDTQVVTSTNGITWTIINPGVANMFYIAHSTGFETRQAVTPTELSYLSGTTSNVQTQINTLNTTLTANQNNATGNAISSKFAQTAFIALPYNSNSTVAAYSTNGITWSTTTIDSGNYKGSAFISNNFIGYIYNSTTAAISTNGITWSTTTLPSSTGWYAGVSAGGKLVIGSLSSSNIAITTNGTTWTTASGAHPITSMTYGRSLYVSVQGSSNAASYSTDGITWTQTVLPGTSLLYQSVMYNNGVFVAVAGTQVGGATTTAAYSTDGITWTETTVPSGRWNYGVVGNGRFIAFSGASAAGIQSTDGITWSTFTPSAFLQDNGAASNGTIVQTFNNATAVISTNGTTWSTTNIGGFFKNVAANMLYNPTTQLNKITAQTSVSAGTYTVLLSDRNIILNTSANCVITLPEPLAFPGRELTITQINNFAVTSASFNIKPLTSESYTNSILSGAGKYVTLVSNGNAWEIMEAN